MSSGPWKDFCGKNYRQALREPCPREQMYGHQGERAGAGGWGGGMSWEIGIDMYTLICIK